ncbi:MAG: protein kinase [Anaerolineae bacterium]|nr:protein kinase [Anaerolineae bacterium]
MSLTQGTVLINRYQVAKLLKQGAPGAVYRAWDLSLNIAVILKETSVSGLEAQDAFRSEALMLTKLNHPNLARVTDYFSIPNEGQYLVMAYIQGDDLDAMLARGGVLPENQLIPWSIQVLNALEYMHNQQPPVIHRDIKPANIKIDPRGNVILVGFEAGKCADPAPGRNADKNCFQPPEQGGKGRIDARSDIYALGATLYTLLTGIEPPEAVKRQSGQPLPSPRSLNGSISPRIDAALVKAMQMAPDKRFQHALEMKQALLSLAAVTADHHAAARTPHLAEVPPVPADAIIPQSTDGPSHAVASGKPDAAERGSPPKLVLSRPVATAVLLLLAAAVVTGMLLINRPASVPMDHSTPTRQATSSPLPASATAAAPTRTPTKARTLTPTPVFTATATAQPTWYPCADAPPSQLNVGMRAHVSLDPALANNVRASAGKSFQLLGKIQPGETVRIVNGPDCADTWVWWRIRSESSGLEGWTAEGDFEDHWLVPLP